MKFELPKNHFPYIKETLFVSRYLPAFAEGNRELCLEWVEKIAISPMAEVRVVKDDNIDEIVFMIPPLLNGPMGENRGNIVHILERFEKLSKTGLGAKTANNYIQNTCGTIFKETQPKEIQARWKEILLHYGLIKDKEKKNDATTETSLASDFDDWT